MVTKQPLVVGDDHERAVRPPQPVHALRDHLEGVDVEAGVRLVQDSEAGLQYGHLEHFAALFLSSGEALVDGALEHPGVDAQGLDLLAERA